MTNKQFIKIVADQNKLSHTAVRDVLKSVRDAARQDLWYCGQAMVPRRYYLSDASMTLCKCPCCGVTHGKMLFWTGRGTPRVFCDPCRKEASGPEDYEVNTRNKRRIKHEDDWEEK
jgi:hypothetical protein